jgi:hypothetical protein
MKKFIVALFLGLALAGCVGDEDSSLAEETLAEQEQMFQAAHPTWVIGKDGELDATEYPGELPVFDMRYVTTRISGEPTVGITRHGSVIFSAIDFDQGVAGQTQPFGAYMRSWDQGQTWEDVTPNQLNTVPNHPVTGDPYVHVDPDTGRIFIVDMLPSVACNSVSWSDNEGKSWSVPRHGACPLPVADHPTLFTGPGAGIVSTAGDLLDQYPNVVYLCSNQIAQAKCAYSLTGGLDWEPAVLVFPGVDPVEADPNLDNLCSGFTSHGTTDRNDGTVYIPRSLCGTPALSISTDGGMTYEWNYVFEEPQYQTEPGVHDTMVAVDKNGTLYYFWIGGGGATAYLAISHDQGMTFEEPINVTAPGVTAMRYPGIVAGEDGRVSFLYMGSDNPRGHAVGNDLDNETNRQIWENATWNAYIGYSLNADAGEPVFAITTANSIFEPLKRGECVDRCPGNGREGGPYDFLDIEMDPITGQVYAAIVDVCTGFCDESGTIAGAPQRSHGAVGVQIAGTRLTDGTEYDRP